MKLIELIQDRFENIGALLLIALGVFYHTEFSQGLVSAGLVVWKINHTKTEMK